MPLLTQVRSSLLTPDLLQFLHRRGVRTWEDLLLLDIDHILRSTSPEESRLCLKVQELVLDLSSGCSPCTSALHLLNPPSCHAFAFGCASLDHLLDGGLKAGTVTEIAGAEGSGKTQLCLQLAASAALNARAAVFYLDTSAAFSAHRLADILGGLAGESDLLHSRWSDCLRAMKCIVCSRSTDIFSALDILEDLKPAPHQPPVTRTFVSNIKVLIVDSVSAAAAPVLGGSNPQGHALMMHLGRVLLQLASQLNVAVLVTNHIILGDDGVRRPGLGESWKAVPHGRILLEKDDSTNICTARLVKHTHLRCR